MSKIQPNDKYRIEKALEIYYETQTIPTEYFRKTNPNQLSKTLISMR